MSLMLLWGGSSAASDTVALVDFQSPANNPRTGAGGQRFRALVRRTGSETPRVALDLYESGGFVANLLTGVDVTSADGQIVTAYWNAASLADASGAGVQLRIVGPHNGGSTVEIGAAVWESQESAVGTSALAGTAAIAAASSAALDHVVTLAGAAIVAGSAAGAVSVAIPLAAAALAGASAAGGLHIAVALAGSAVAAALADAELTVVPRGEANLVGAAVASGLASATLQLDVKLAGTAAAGLAANGNAVLTVPLTAAAQAAAQASGALTVGITLTGDAVIGATASGNLPESLIDGVPEFTVVATPRHLSRRARRRPSGRAPARTLSVRAA